MILTDELCDRLCAAALEKSREIGIDISLAVSDENGLPRVYRRYGEGSGSEHYACAGQGLYGGGYPVQDKGCGCVFR